MSETWTIGELAERAAHALRTAAGPGASTTAPNGRVRDVPNERLIRWYTTIGLLDPPLARRGRVALYGRRHLMQLVAIKRRQAAGRSIAQIQAELAGATDAVLAEIAGLPPAAAETATPAESASTARATTATTDGPGRFWTRGAAAARLPAAPPAPSAPGTTDGRPLTTDAEAGAADAARIDPAPPPFGSSAPARPAAAPPAAPASAPPSAVPPPPVHAGPRSVPRPASLPGQARRPHPAAATPGTGSAPAPELVQGIRIAPEVTLLLGAARRPLGEDDLAAITAAARPLLDVLRERGLAAPAGEDPP